MINCTILSLRVCGMQRLWDKPAYSSGQAPRWRRCRVGDRRHRKAEEGPALGRRGSAICFSLGQAANCQTLVSLTLARGEVPVMVALRLFPPEN
jgi:hypothetical protein